MCVRSGSDPPFPSARPPHACARENGRKRISPLLRGPFPVPLHELKLVKPKRFSDEGPCLHYVCVPVSLCLCVCMLCACVHVCTHVCVCGISICVQHVACMHTCVSVHGVCAWCVHMRAPAPPRAGVLGRRQSENAEGPGPAERRAPGGPRGSEGARRKRSRRSLSDTHGLAGQSRSPRGRGRDA